MCRRPSRRGFTLVELMIVVAIIGILAALAIYGVTRYTRNAKTAEARSALGAMVKGNITYYNTEQWLAKVPLVPGTSAASLNVICATSTNTVPSGGAPKGTKWQSSDAEWTKDTTIPATGWVCLKFSMDQPQAFQYAYEATSPKTPQATFTAIAHGDLNGDNNTSTFSLAGGLESARVIIAPSISETSPEE